MACIEVVEHGVVVGGRSYYHEVGVAVCRGCVGGGLKVKFLLRKVLLYIVVLDRGYPIVDFIYFVSNYVDSSNMLVLSQQRRY